MSVEHGAQITVEGLSYLPAGNSSDSSPILNDISFTVGHGEIVSVVGPSGGGKSTLLSCLAGLLTPSSGKIAMALPDGSAPRLGLTLQRPALLPWRSVLNNVLLPFELGAEENGSAEKAQYALKLCGMENAGSLMPAELSGGMASRVALARAIVNDPNILFLDEPFGALDEMTGEKLLVRLGELLSTLGATALMVTHSLAHAAYLSDRVVVLSRRPGRISAVIGGGNWRQMGHAAFREPGFQALMGQLRDALWSHE